MAVIQTLHLIRGGMRFAFQPLGAFRTAEVMLALDGRQVSEPLCIGYADLGDAIQSLPGGSLMGGGLPLFILLRFSIMETSWGPST